MFAIILSVFVACNKSTPVYNCTEAEVLQECDDRGEHCVDLQDCKEDELICHAEMGHCMAMEDDTDDSGMTGE